MLTADFCIGNTHIRIHRPNLTPEEREQRLREIERDMSRALGRVVTAVPGPIWIPQELKAEETQA